MEGNRAGWFWGTTATQSGWMPSRTQECPRTTDHQNPETPPTKREPRVGDETLSLASTDLRNT
ncbi:hypothetical protein LBMAG38_11050 [Chloroflexota bacterium]|nr:hypothetical protein LBMAG38_11050 [Chloroflexota bacterium]